MALIVEDGSGVENANSYISLADAQAYLTARDVNTTLTEGLLLRAMDMLNTLDYIGYKTSSSQPLPFPRNEFNYWDSIAYARLRFVDLGRPLLEGDAIPQDLINAQVWAAYYIANGNDPMTVPSAGVIMEKVDVLEVEYNPNQTITGMTVDTLPNVKNSLRWLLKPMTKAIRRA